MFEQICDRIRFRSESYDLSERPLDEYLKATGMNTLQRDRCVPFDYRATWEFSERNLYLVSLADGDGDDFFDKVFENQTLPVFADWFTGKLYFSVGGSIHGGYCDLDATFTLEVENGELRSIDELRRAEAASEKQADEMAMVKGCSFLLFAATPDAFRTNAFRVTGLPVGTAQDDLCAALAEHLERQSDPEIATLLQRTLSRVQRPQERIVEEFFWFWPGRFGSEQGDLALEAIRVGDYGAALQWWQAAVLNAAERAIAMHNLAILYLLLATEAEDRLQDANSDRSAFLETASYWQVAGDQWKQLASVDHIFELVNARARASDPVVRESFAQGVKNAVVDVVAHFNAQLVVHCIRKGHDDLASFHMEMFRTWCGDRRDMSIRAALWPVEGHLKNEMGRAEQRVKKNFRDGLNVARDLLSRCKLDIRVYEAFSFSAVRLEQRFFDRIATLSLVLPEAYHEKTGDDAGYLEILTAGLNYAQTDGVKERLKRRLRLVEHGKRF